MLSINSDVKFVKGVGPKSQTKLNKNGIFTVLDLLLYFPRAYEGVKYVEHIDDCFDKEKIFIYAKVISVNRDIRPKPKMTISTVILETNGVRFNAVWFNQPYAKNSFILNNTYLLKGTCKKKSKVMELMNPKIIRNSKGDKDKLIAIYPQKGSITSNYLNKIISNLLIDIKIIDNIPEYIINKYRLLDLNTAIHNIHSPKSQQLLAQAQRRLKFQELFTYSLKVLSLKNKYKFKEGKSIPISKDLIVIKESLPFKLTKAQSKVVREIIEDQHKAVAMNRLVQGDVGSGKTIVAIIAMFNVVKANYQALMMAPTEILAKQHFKEVTERLSMFGIKTQLLTGSVTAKNKLIIKEKLQSGEIDIIIGTHALIEDDVKFKNLALIITDEQHRFGVNQRCKLSNKNSSGDVLVMTATPIPRTLSLCLYGDLDQSIIDELPPNRKTIETSYLNIKQKKKAYEFALEQVKDGRQVYVVCPLVNKNEKMDLSSVEELYDELKDTYFKNIDIAILHGKINAKDKERIMGKFKDGSIRVLIATTVIEVGVDVPNATVMIIENAERFGLSQLHQLRGRVGRGEYKSYCILLANIKSDHTRKRMEIMKNVSNGFVLAEEDLKIRGSGELFGFRQHGDSELLISDPVDDFNIFKAANDEAKLILSSNDENTREFKKYVETYINNSKNYICFN